METWLLLLVALLLPVVLLLARRGASEAHGRGARIPPGPMAVPVLGSLLWLRYSLADVEPLLRRLMARHGPVVSLRMGPVLSVFVADRRVAHAALVARGAALADRQDEATRGLGLLLGERARTISGAGYGPAWRLLRRNLVSETLHPSRVRLFAPARAWVRRVLADKLRREEQSSEAAAAPVMEAFRYAMFCLLVLMCFGERLDEAAVRAIGAAQRDWLLFAARKMGVFAFCPAVTKRLFRGRLEMGLALRQRQKELFMPLIDARRDRKKKQTDRGSVVPSEDTNTSTTTFEHSYVDTLLDIMLPDDEGDRALADDEMVSLCSEFLNAGTDTTSTALEWIMAELVKNPRIQEKLYNEITKTTSGAAEEVTEEELQSMPYIKAVVLEGLRKHPPGHFVLPHRASEDVEAGGYLFPKGAMVNFMVAEMGRDEREWERPMEFAPERFLPGGDGEGVDVTGSREIRMMPFGAGRRICAGLGVAMLHLEYFVANLVREFEWKEVPGDEVDFAERPEFTVVMAKPLRARLVSRIRNSS
ncbi:hypothetical protein BRADI_3g30520v3 [Brachypodium distachyon]|uniref:Cytochrome P450 n=2 Tax=Brachypodium distachyon TaxID=15368 RepID=I1I5A5_BRADI|nr:hypothetical protein BRADI_3g30520v3 [Brachypodium distachyon]